jgi:glycosyltransferase involved in cell wall biosynthesis
MKVCFIAGTLGRGGAERQLLYMLRALQSEGIYTRVLCLTEGEDFEKEICDLGIEVEWIGSSGLRVLRLLKMLKKIRERPVDVLHSTHFYTNIYAAIVGRILKIESIGAIRNDLISEIAANGIYGRWHLKLPQHLIANSESALSRAEGFGVKQENLHFLRNVVEPKRRREAGTGIIEKRINILFAGRLVPQKRPELFVRLASTLTREMPGYNLSFQIAGDGPLRMLLEKLVREGDFSYNQFVFLGAQADMSDTYCRTDIFVSTSKHEGTPNVVLEAMAYGIPVVATKVGGIPEILDDDCGILVDESDFDELLSATTKLIRDPRLRHRLGQNGQKYVTNSHSHQYLREHLTDIYSCVMRRDQRYS